MSEAKAKPGFWSPENLRQLGIFLLIVLAVRWSVAAPYHVPTASMEPTIKVGDRLLAWKLAYDFKIPFTDKAAFTWAEPERGDIIVFRYPKEPSTDYVKRIVGLPGDKIRVEDNILFVNDQPQERTDHEFDRKVLADITDRPEMKTLSREKLGNVEHWVIQDKISFSNSRYPVHGGEYVVPPESFFVMGDNRDNSTDSRIWNQVPRDYIHGKALFVMWSAYTLEGESWLEGFRVRWARFGHPLASLNP